MSMGKVPGVTELSADQMAVLAGLADSIKGMGEGKKAVGTTHSGVLLHGPGGIFSSFGSEREVITAHIQSDGIGKFLPLRPSMDTDPRYPSITGITASSGSQPTNTCDTAPNAYLKGCYLTSRFGRLRFDTNTIEFDKVITRYNRGDFMDLMLLGQLIGDEQIQAGLVPEGITEDDILNVATVAEMMVAGVQAQRELTRQMWQGSILIDHEFPGLDGQIATGQVDADTNVACPALDSDVKDFALDNVCGTGRDIVEYVSMMDYYLHHIARRTSLNPVTWVLAMREEMFYELSACWPCRYLTNRCANAAGTAVGVINDENNVKMRDDMRDGMYLWVNGRKMKVVTDDGIFEHNSSNNANLNDGQYASTIYQVPMTVLGNFPVTYREYLNYKSGVAAKVAPFSNFRRPDFWSDRGVFSWAYDGQLWCFMLGLKTEQRIVLRAPHLAGRIDNVMYEPIQHLRDSDPDGAYFADGGLSARPIPQRTSYAVWASGAIAAARS